MRAKRTITKTYTHLAIELCARTPTWGMMCEQHIASAGYVDTRTGCVESEWVHASCAHQNIAVCVCVCQGRHHARAPNEEIQPSTTTDTRVVQRVLTFEQLSPTGPNIHSNKL
jgi:hypothetical protein